MEVCCYSTWSCSDAFIVLAVFNDFGTLAIAGPSLLPFIEGTVNQRITETSTWQYCCSGVSASFLVRRGEGWWWSNVWRGGSDVFGGGEWGWSDVWGGGEWGWSGVWGGAGCGEVMCEGVQWCSHHAWWVLVCIILNSHYMCSGFSWVMKHDHRLFPFKVLYKWFHWCFLLSYSVALLTSSNCNQTCAFVSVHSAGSAGRSAGVLCTWSVHALAVPALVWCCMCAVFTCCSPAHSSSLEHQVQVIGKDQILPTLALQ